jgi:hypothetical protein
MAIAWFPSRDRRFTRRGGQNRGATIPAVAARHAAIEQSSHCVAVFLEPFRCNLLQWLRDRPAGTPGSDDDVLRLEPQLLGLAEFVNRRGLRHMDAHFENLVTDGEEIYLTDFGLAISDTFELSASEHAFFERHRSPRAPSTSRPRPRS